jgi:pyruvate-ferredoxin/flavodoxin oxidoreductase
MQACFFALAEVMPMAQALAAMGAAIEHSYAKKGRHIVASNLAAIEAAIAGLREITPTQLGTGQTGATQLGTTTPDSGEALGIPGPWEGAPTAVRELVVPQLQRRGDQLPVSALPCDGSFASGTSQWEKRNIAETIPIWEPDLCVQCGKCVMVCPHAVIRAKTVEPELLLGAPEGFRSTPAHDPAWEGQGFTIQVAAEDCTGCSLCVEVCPARDHSNPRRKALNMAPQRPLRQQSSSHWNFFLLLPDPDRRQLNRHHVAQQQLQQPLFEFSGACAGCGETPYLKLASQLFGDRMVIANATGCSSIYGGNLPTTPWTTNPQGRGPAWSNSLFEDNAEFGLGFRIAFDQRRARAEQLLRQLSQPSQDSLPCPGLTDPFIQALIEADQSDEAGIHEQRQRVEALNQLLCRQLDHNQLGDTNTGDTNSWARELLELGADLVKRSVWIVGGDGWAYDIGFGGIDHLLASNHNVNLLVLDTEVYSNTGGQMSKATPKGAVAKFASGGKTTAKKDLGLMAMTYGSAYVASVAMGARDEHTLRVFLEAESFPGPSLILAYSHCIAHGIDMAKGMHQQRQAVACGRWLLYRHDPRRRAQGLPALVLDSAPPSLGLEEAMAGENRFRMLQYSQPEQARSLTKQAQGELNERFALYQRLATTPPAPGR